MTSFTVGCAARAEAEIKLAKMVSSKIHFGFIWGTLINRLGNAIPGRKVWRQKWASGP
jgi:hypothetical protein